MFNDLSKRVNAIKPSPTLAVSNLASQLRAQGRDVIGLGAGEPDFDTPEHIREAGIAAINGGDTHYTAVDGTPALKQAIVDKFKRDNGLTIRPTRYWFHVAANRVFSTFARPCSTPATKSLFRRLTGCPTPTS